MFSQVDMLIIYDVELVLPLYFMIFDTRKIKKKPLNSQRYINVELLRRFKYCKVNVTILLK